MNWYRNEWNQEWWKCEMINVLTLWGRVTHICVDNLTVLGSDNGLSPGRRQAIIWTNAGILLIGPLGTNFSEISIEIQTFSLKKIRLKMSSAKYCSFRLGLNVLKWFVYTLCHCCGLSCTKLWSPGPEENQRTSRVTMESFSANCHKPN